MSHYLILTAFYDINKDNHAMDATVSVNTDHISYISDKGEGGCKLKFVSGNSQGEMNVRQSFADVNAALNPVAVYTQKEQPK